MSMNLTYLSRKIYEKVCKYVVQIVFLVSTIVTPINLVLRPDFKSIFIQQYVVTIASVLLVLGVSKAIIIFKLNDSKALYAYALILTFEFYFIILTSIEVNTLVWSLLALNIVMTLFIYNRKIAFHIQGLTYGFHIFFIGYFAHSYLILPQKITATFILILSSVIASVSRNAIKNYLGEVSEKSNALEAANVKIRAFNEALERKVQERTRDLEDTTIELKTALDDLEQAQDEIVKSENMNAYLTLTRGLSHQMNTPLGTILTSSSYLKDILLNMKSEFLSKSLTMKAFEDNTNALYDGLVIIGGNTDKLISIVEALKQFTSFSKPVVIEFSQLMKSVHSHLKTGYPESEVVLDNKVSKDTKVLLSEDVAVNILGVFMDNAMKYSASKSSCLQIKCIDDNNFIYITITDQGRGMTLDVQERIFEPYFTTDPHSLGMGLFIAKNVVEYTLNGEIKLVETSPSGSSFQVTIPKKKSV